jgi:aminoglycoside phosphotransferase (APT) family kinase protein
MVAVTERPPYDRTAVRPGWHELPSAVRAAVGALSGAEVTDVVLAGGGFTRGFAALCRIGNGDEVFVKAASHKVRPIAHRSYLAEAAVLRALPAGVPAPRLRWFTEVAEWVVLGIDPIRGRMPGLPWTLEDVRRGVGACERAAAALHPAPENLPLTRLADDLSGDDDWRSLFADAARGHRTAALLSPWARESLRELQRLVEVSTTAIDGDTACHGDLRADNIIVDRTGTAWICDWNWLSLGAPWTDVVGLLVTAHADGIDVEAVMRRSWLLDGVDDEAVDSWLALIAAFMIGQADSAAPEFASGWLNAHRAHFGTSALSWLEHRRTG